MKEIVFATNNNNKLVELEHLLKENFKVLGLKDIGCNEDIPENQNTLEGNATEKSNYVYKNYKLSCFADDTGLEIEALNGEPGVYSARYAGASRSSEDNMKLVLEKLTNITYRKARFRTIISLNINGNEKQFEGVVNGRILTEKHGDEGFGYDPIFAADGYDISFAEMSIEDKNKISHRGNAVRKLVEYLNSLED